MAGFSFYFFNERASKQGSSEVIILMRSPTRMYPSRLRPLWRRGELAKTFVPQLGRGSTWITGDVRETDFLRQRLSVTIQRSNALAIRGSLALQKDIGLDDPLN